MSIILKAKSKTFIKRGHSNWFWIMGEDASSPHSHRPSSVWRSMTRWCFHIDLLFIPLPWINFFLLSTLRHSWKNTKNYTEFWCGELFCSELACWLKLIAFSSFSSTFFFFFFPLIHSQTFAPLEKDEDVCDACKFNFISELPFSGRNDWNKTVESRNSLVLVQSHYVCFK